MSKKIRTILNIQQKSPKFIIVLAVMSIIIFYILTAILAQFFNIGSFRVPVQETFFIISLGLPIVFSYYLIDKPPHFTFWEVMVILGVFFFNIMVLTVLAPKLMPSVFAVPASIIKMSVYSLVGIP